ncbi:MAG TPA: RNA 3'-terminal phosphate cyclase [Kofleriaceae bacterium]
MREGLVEIDGSSGEGGGQILRTSLALSIITGRPLRISNIRAGRAKPGLRRQHLACVEAAAQLCGAELRGAQVGSQQLEFTPPAAGMRESMVELTVDIGSAGSTSLVVQTILVPAIMAGRSLRATVIGGTHNPMAPPFDFLARVFVPHLRAMGADVTLTLERHGFATGGGASHDEITKHRGEVTLVVGPGGLRPIAIIETPPITERHATAILARLPTHVAEREFSVVKDRCGFTPIDCEIREVHDAGIANVVMLEVARGECRELVTSFGEKGLRAELVAERACDELNRFLAAEVPVGEHLADQLLLPLAVAGGGRFRAAGLSLHATTNIETIQHFLDIPIRVAPDGDATLVTVG